MPRSKVLKEDKEIVPEAIKQNGQVCSCASEVLMADKQVVLEAVKQNWRALKYASKELRADKQVGELSESWATREAPR